LLGAAGAENNDAREWDVAAQEGRVLVSVAFLGSMFVPVATQGVTQKPTSLTKPWPRHN
jgi:hypothetical protein